LAGALLRPKAAEHERSLERALTYIREHAGEELTLSQVAKVAGFAPSYFSRLFAASERTTFQKYLAGLRVERAQSMLESTDVAIERVGKLSGFRSRTRFHLAFKQACGVTPAGYRERCRA
ncbi:MAG TPA: AraC family transcriptional regulator, partial [Polyangiaceae bacterium]|nr:AraC family transcriptional regulator [Polyangiaceae bacterium]